ncbi:MAG TPA: ElyC/SanA/YdcF family protein [Polyangiaceae bacterium]|nr:ElyC/SanA/YdcF family protein [Polyangiaceae bacterium]
MVGRVAVCVLGCGFELDAGNVVAPLPGALTRRVSSAVSAAAHVAREQRGDGEPALVVASGGRRWHGVIEADAMRAELVRAGVPAETIVCERCSLSTRENARFTAALLRRRGMRRALVVTCDWHLPRALAAFRRTGLEVEGFAAPSVAIPLRRRVVRWGRERVLAWAVGIGPFVLGVGGCSRGHAAGASVSDAAIEGGPRGADVLTLIERAEDQRRAKDVPAEAQRTHDPVVRRRAARAYARILDSDDAPLLRALADDDEEVTAWAAYGLGESCHGKEDAHVSALSARLASMDAARPVRAPLDARLATLRALGRCAGDVAEQTLRAWIRRADAAVETQEAAAFAIGDVASRRGSLSLESAGALLDATQRTPALDAALYPLGRNEVAGGEELAPRVLASARAALARPGPSRFFAVRALGRSGADAAGDLAHVLASKDFTAPERAEAARGLARLHKAGRAALADALGAIVPASAGALGSDDFGVLAAAVEATGDQPTKSEAAPLWALTRIEPDASATPTVARRASQLRCAAAAKLAHGAWDSDVLRGCDVADGEAGENARLEALDKGDLTKARRAAWLELTHSAHLRVREAAIEMIERHPEAGDAALPPIADALASGQAGLVATAADVVHAHPDRMYTLAASEKRAALDPAAPPPTANPLKEVNVWVAKGLRDAMAHPWSEDLVETRVAVLDAALALGLDEAKPYAQAACHDANATVRTRAAKALAAAGQKDATCPAPEKPEDVAPEAEAPLAHATRVVFDTDAGSFGIRFDPALAPVAASRFVALARSGFYTGVVVHRVVPGFVVQLGDRGGDGYGGSGQSLRCETSPVPFGALDVGVALAGRDTGSSQVFVTLARHPHLDGEYAWVGRADGDWDAVAEGDVVRAVHVEP